MKKIFFVAVFAFASLNFVACSSDDSTPVVTPPTTDNPNPNPEPEPQPENVLVGTWKATTLSYTIPGTETTHQFAFDHPSLKGGCATDFLTVSKGTVVSLKQNNKNASDACVDLILPGTWTDSTISIQGEEAARKVVSVTQTELVLNYGMSFNGRSTDVNVKYVKQ